MPDHPARAVFDTNVVVSALVFGRRLGWLRTLWARGAVIPLLCRETTAELLRVLAYPKFRLDRTERESLLEDYLPFSEIVRLPRPLPVLPVACRNRDDAVFLHLALASGADFLVSGDQDLAALRRAAPVAILAPRELAARFPPG